MFTTVSRAKFPRWNFKFHKFLSALKILVIDNYDSFVYNLVHYLKAFGCEVDVVRNDKADFKEINKYDKILLSQGPGILSKAGKMIDVCKEFSEKKPILGVFCGIRPSEKFLGEN